jgi:hypothetical protein
LSPVEVSTLGISMHMVTHDVKTRGCMSLVQYTRSLSAPR